MTSNQRGCGEIKALVRECLSHGSVLYDEEALETKIKLLGSEVDFLDVMNVLRAPRRALSEGGNIRYRLIGETIDGAVLNVSIVFEDRLTIDVVDIWL